MLRSALYSLRLLLRHPVARATPLATLSRIARWQWRARRSNGLLRTEWINGAVLVAGHGHSGASGNIYFGLHEYEDMAFFAHLLRPGDGFIDAGANIGAYSVMASAVSGARVHAFEPASETLPVLRENFSANAIEGTIHGVALGAQEGKARFTTGRGATNRLDSEGEVDVEICRLDTMEIEAIAMKADLEGGETAMLRGATGTLDRLWAIALETVDEEAATLLRDAGFVERGYDPATRSLLDRPTRTAFNVLWIRQARLEDVAARLRGGPKIFYGGFAV